MNCLLFDNETPEKSIKNLLERDTTLKLIAVLNSPDEIINTVNQTRVDLIFINADKEKSLDIMDLLPLSMQYIIFSSSHVAASKAFDIGVTDYLVLPVDKARFEKAIKRANEKSLTTALKSEETKDLFVRSEYKVIKVAFEKLLYVEALADYVVFHTSDHMKHIVHSTMKGTFDRLPQDKFIRIHRSYIINRDKIDFIDNQSVIIEDKHLPIGALYKDSFYERLNFL